MFLGHPPQQKIGGCRRRFILVEPSLAGTLLTGCLPGIGAPTTSHLPHAPNFSLSVIQLVRCVGSIPWSTRRHSTHPGVGYRASRDAQALLPHGTVRVVQAPILPAGRLVPCSAHLNPPDGLQGVPSTWGDRRHPGHRAPSSMRSLYLGHGLRSAAFGCRLPTGVRSALCAVYAHDASLPLGGWGARCSPRRVRACGLPCCPCVCCPRRLPSR